MLKNKKKKKKTALEGNAFIDLLKLVNGRTSFIYMEENLSFHANKQPLH